MPNLLDGPPFALVFQRSDSQAVVDGFMVVTQTRRFWPRLVPRRWRSGQSR